MAESSRKGEKTLWKKEKLLITSNFSFSRSVFKTLVRQTRKNLGLFGKGLKHLQTIMSKGLKCLNLHSTEWKTLWEKEKMLVTSMFSFSNTFYNAFKKAFLSGSLKVLIMLYRDNLVMLKIVWERVNNVIIMQVPSL